VRGYTTLSVADQPQTTWLRSPPIATIVTILHPRRLAALHAAFLLLTQKDARLSNLAQGRSSPQMGAAPQHIWVPSRMLPQASRLHFFLMCAHLLPSGVNSHCPSSPTCALSLPNCVHSNSSPSPTCALSLPNCVHSNSLSSLLCALLYCVRPFSAPFHRSSFNCNLLPQTTKYHGD
jgi:hypothetical protein